MKLQAQFVSQLAFFPIERIASTPLSYSCWRFLWPAPELVGHLHPSKFADHLSGIQSLQYRESFSASGSAGLLLPLAHTGLPVGKWRV
jgi:hypothetical protein